MVGATHASPLRVQEQNTNSGCGAKFLCTGDGPTYVILRGPTYVILRGPTYVILRGPTYVILRGPTYVILRGPTYVILRGPTYVILRDPTYVILRGPTYVILRGPTYVILRGPTYVILRAVAGSGRGPRHRQRDSATARRMTPESLFSLTRLLARTGSFVARLYRIICS